MFSECLLILEYRTSVSPLLPNSSISLHSFSHHSCFALSVTLLNSLFKLLFKYLGVQFSSDGQWDGEIDRRIAAAGAVFHSLYRSIVTKRELSRQTKIAVFKTIFRPILTYGCENWVITENVRSRLQAAEMRFLRRAAGHTRWDRIPNSEIRTLFQIEPLLLFIERQQLRWLGHVLRMPYDRLARSVFEAVPKGKRPRGRPRNRWCEYMAGLCWERLGVPWAEVPRVASDREHWEVLM